MNIRQRPRKTPGQALVEFALTITLLFLMISAVIDLGLAFFAHQGIAGAAAEGAAYAALMPNNGATANDAAIRDRARYEGGADPNLTHRARFVNLMDLNNDGADDTAAVVQTMISVSSVQNEANIRLGGLMPCENSGSPPRRTAQFCDMVVTVRYNYKPFFSAASFFGANLIQLSATRQMTISR